ncbi:MAG: MBL fold metallo-hydrolase [Elusimicrobiota bacterium]
MDRARRSLSLLALTFCVAVPSFPADEVPPAGPSAPVPGVESDAKSKRPFNVFFVNVGQGDSQYIELPNGQNALIDGGPSKARIRTFLESKGVTRIDHVVLTHPHDDHYKGLNYVFDELQVSNFYDTKIDNTGAQGDNTLRQKAVDEPGCAIHYPRPGEALDWGEGVSAKVFNSCPDPVTSGSGLDGGAEINNCSIVIRVSAEGRSAFFSGDVQSQAESAMVSRFGAELKSDILKVPHHGSAESSSQAFLDAVKPGRAVLSVGKNGYGLPTDVVLSRFQAMGIPVHRTDVDGTLDGSSLFDKLLAAIGLKLPASLPLAFEDAPAPPAE